MTTRRSLFNTNSNLTLARSWRSEEEKDARVIVRFGVINRHLVLSISSQDSQPTIVHQSSCPRSSRSLEVPTANFENEEMAKACTSDMLSDINVHPDVIEEEAPEIALVLRSWIEAEIPRGHNSMEVEIHLDIELCEYRRIEDEGIGIFDYYDEDAALALATTESLNIADSMQPVSRGLVDSTSSSSSEVGAFFLRCRAHAWDSGTECMICLECLGEGEKDEEVISLPCSHLFHGVCVRRWFEVSYACPICRSAANVCLTSMENR